MDKLTLEHLAPYLPYGLKMSSHGRIYTLCGFILESAISIQDKPILRPLSEITIDFFKENIDDAIVDFLINCEPENNHFSVEVCEKVIGWSALSYEEYQLFFKNRFDVFGLHNKGLCVYLNEI